MDDTKRFKIQFKGTAYTFAEIPSDDFTRLTVVLNMHASPGKGINMLFRVLSQSAGAEQWDAITDRYVAREIDIDDFTALLKKLIAKQNEASKATDDGE